MAKLLIFLGVALALAGAGLLLAERATGLRLGQLPGDLRMGGERVRVYMPLASSLLVSALLSLALWLLSRFRR